MAEKTGFIFMFDEWPLISQLSDAQIGKLMKAIVEYETTGNIIEMPKLVSMAFFSIKGRLDRFDALRAKRSEAGKMGGAPKGNQNARKHDGTTSKQPQISENKQNKPPVPVPEPIPEPEPEPEPVPVPGPGPGPEPKEENGAPGFDRFWSVYPRRVGKQDALKAWGQLNPDDALVDLIVAGVERWKTCDQWTKDNGTFICYPATFLRGRRWEEDDRPDVPPSPPKGAAPKKDYDDDEDFLSARRASP